MNAGDTFFVRTDDDHLWVVVSDPVADPFRVVVVPLLSDKEWVEQDCVLDRGDHEFIKHRTCVIYSGATFISVARAVELEAGGKMDRRQPMPPSVLGRIRAALQTSDIPLKYFEVLRQQGLVF